MSPVKQAINERKKEIAKKINNFSYFTETEKKNLIELINSIDTFISLESSISEIEKKMSDFEQK